MNGILIHKIGELGNAFAFFPPDESGNWKEANINAERYLSEHPKEDLQASVVSITPPKENTDE